jgi:hypothetical protein
MEFGHFLEFQIPKENKRFGNRIYSHVKETEMEIIAVLGTFPKIEASSF